MAEKGKEMLDRQFNNVVVPAKEVSELMISEMSEMEEVQSQRSSHRMLPGSRPFKMNNADQNQLLIDENKGGLSLFDDDEAGLLE